MNFRIFRDYADVSIEPTEDEPDDREVFRTFGEAKTRLMNSLREGIDQLADSLRYLRELRRSDIL